MAWFLNYYKCTSCGRDWTDEWSCMCDDNCPHCGARHMSPGSSDDLTEVIEKRGREYVVLRSPETAGHCPDYRELGFFRTKKAAERWLTIEYE